MYLHGQKIIEVPEFLGPFRFTHEEGFSPERANAQGTIASDSDLVAKLPLAKIIWTR